MNDKTARPVVHLSTRSAWRGAERQLQQLHEGLLERGWPSRIVCRSPSVFPDIPEVRAIPWNGPADPIAWARFWKHCRDLRPQLLHCHDTRAFAMGSVLGELIGTPVLATHHTPILSRHALNRLRFRSAKGLIATSPGIQEELRSIAPKRPTFCVPLGVHGEPPRAAERAAARKRLAVDEETVIIGSVGYFGAGKQPDLLLDLATHLAQVRRNVVVALIGPLDSELARSARRMSNVIATGLVRDALDYYAAFDLYVSSSASEGPESALLDAIVRDVPAFAVDSGGSRELLSPLPRLAAAGDRYDFFRMLERALDTRESLVEDTRKLGVESRQRFTVEAMVTGTIAVYDSLRVHGN